MNALATLYRKQGCCWCTRRGRRGSRLGSGGRRRAPSVSTYCSQGAQRACCCCMTLPAGRSHQHFHHPPPPPVCLSRRVVIALWMNRAAKVAYYQVVAAYPVSAQELRFGMKTFNIEHSREVGKAGSANQPGLGHVITANAVECAVNIHFNHDNPPAETVEQLTQLLEASLRRFTAAAAAAAAGGRSWCRAPPAADAAATFRSPICGCGCPGCTSSGGAPLPAG
jgi:hypothetical protein